MQYIYKFKIALHISISISHLSPERTFDIDVCPSRSFSVRLKILYVLFSVKTDTLCSWGLFCQFASTLGVFTTTELGNDLDSVRKFHL